MAAYRRGVQLGLNNSLSGLRRFDHMLGFDYTSFCGSNSSNEMCGFECTRRLSQLVKPIGKHVFLVDTLALVRSLEAQGVPSKQAEAITGAITEVLNDSLENVSHSFVSKAEMQRMEMVQEANISKFKSEVQSSQEHHFSLLQRETEKLRGDIEKMRSELRSDFQDDIEKMRSELTSVFQDNTKNQIDNTKEIHGLRAQFQAGKYEVIKYCIGTLVFISAVGLAVL